MKTPSTGKLVNSGPQEVRPSALAIPSKGNGTVPEQAGRYFYLLSLCNKYRKYRQAN